jgi:serine/threonine-protein kinase
MSTNSHFANLRSEVYRKLSEQTITPQQAEREIAEIDQADRSTPSNLGDSQFSGATQMPGTTLPAPQRGDQVSHFELIEHLGSGGMGVVWKAKDLETERLVVAKFVLGHLRGIPAVVKIAKESFVAAHGLRHSALCALIDFVNDPRLGPCVIMDYVPGITLARYRKAFVEHHGEFPVRQACRILEPIAGALDEAHRHGVIHRDVKPDNIVVILDKSGRLTGAKLIDLGVAATVQDAISQYSVAAPEIDVVGTPLYWAPEQCKGHHPTAQTDQYALAAVAYELLAGHPPFAASNRVQLLAFIKDEMPEPIALQTSFVNETLMKGMAKKRENRFETCTKFLAALAAVRSEPTEPGLAIEEAKTTAPATNRQAALSTQPKTPHPASAFATTVRQQPTTSPIADPEFPDVHEPAVERSHTSRTPAESVSVQTLKSDQAAGDIRGALGGLQSLFQFTGGWVLSLLIGRRAWTKHGMATFLRATFGACIVSPVIGLLLYPVFRGLGAPRDAIALMTGGAPIFGIPLAWMLALLCRFLERRKVPE